MSTGQTDRQEAGDKAAFETRDFTSPAFCAARATTSSTYAPKAVGRFLSFATDRRAATTCWLFTARAPRSRRWRSPQPSRT